jgi:hypothetical protein
VIAHLAQARQRARAHSTPDKGGLNRKDKDLGWNSWTDQGGSMMFTVGESIR